MSRCPCAFLLLAAGLSGSAGAQASVRLARDPVALVVPQEPTEGPGTVLAQRKISSETGGFEDTLDNSDSFGTSAAALGDLDGDGIADIAIGAPNDEDGGGPGDESERRGAVWLLFLRSDGTVREHRKINATLGGFHGELEQSTGFGSALAALGDLDGDGVSDLAVGAPSDRDGGAANQTRGAVWILFLHSDGSVKDECKISATHGGFAGALDDGDRFGSALAAPGDVDRDGVLDLVVGAPRDDDGGGNRGALYVLFLRSDGSVRAHQKVSATQGGFTGRLDNFDLFGSSAVAFEDLDGDGVVELVAGAPWDDETNRSSSRGALWVLFLRSDGMVKQQQKISATQGGFTDPGYGAFFGSSVARLGDLDGDGVGDLAAGAFGDDEGGDDTGSVWILFLNADGTVRAFQKIGDAQGGLSGALGSFGQFGSAVVPLGDLNGDGTPDLGVGAQQDFESEPYAGAAYALFLDPDGTVATFQKISSTQGGFEGTVGSWGLFASSLVALGDLDGDGLGDFAAGTPRDEAVWILFANADGTVRAHARISGAPYTTSPGWDVFGTSVAALGDLDGDGVRDLAVGAPTPGYSGEEVWIGEVILLFLHPDGSVKSFQRIGQGEGGFTAPLEQYDFFGQAVAPLGDLDGDGVLDLAVSSRRALYVLFLRSDGIVKSHQAIPPEMTGGFFSLAPLGDLDGDGVVDLASGACCSSEGGVRILFLRRDGSVRAFQEISSASGGFTGTLDEYDAFGESLAALGDLDGDGVADLAVGAPYDDDGEDTYYYSNRGAVWILFLARDGTVKAHEKISATEGGFRGSLSPGDYFGSSLAVLGDLDGDGLVDLGVGAPQDDDGGYQHGALWLLALDGVAEVDFQSADDPLRTPLVNGQSLASAEGFARVFALTSSGANLGPAVFDSTPRGPNDPGSDPDLLVGRGHVLVLQDSLAPAQTVAGTFDRSGDDPDGGSLTFSFPAPVELLSLDLADIDLGSRGAKVRLTDDSGRALTYEVPAGWTEDLVKHGPPGLRTLDLTTLEPQPGFRGSARAFAQRGFDPRRAVVLEVVLGGSGALDDLRWDPHPPASGRRAVR